MATEPVKYHLIRDFSESRSYRTRFAIRTRDEKTTAEFFYCVLLATLIMYDNETTKQASQEMFSRATAFGNFDHFRISINDLYSLTYIMSNEYEILTKVMQRRLFRIFRLASRGQMFMGEVRPLLLRLEAMINNESAELRMVRRTFTDWSMSTKGLRLAALGQLRLRIRKTSMVADVLPFIDILIKEHQ